MTSNLLISKPAIPKDAMIAKTRGTYADDLWHRNARRGLRHNLARLATAAAYEWVCYDLGWNKHADPEEAYTSTVDHLIIARADMLQSDGVTRVKLSGGDSPMNAPLITTPQPTVFWDFSDGTQITQGSTWLISAVANQGTATAPLAQSTDANKFIRTRDDNQEQLCYWDTSDFNLSIWAGGAGITYAANAYTNPVTNALDADSWVEDSSTGYHRRWVSMDATRIGETIVASVYLKRLGTSTANSSIRVAVDSATGKYSHFNLAAGTCSAETCTGATIEPFDDGWYRCTCWYTFAADSTGPGFLIGLYNMGSYAGDGTTGVYIWGCQYQHYEADRTYLAGVLNTRQYRGVNGRAVAHARGSQFMTTTATLGALTSAGEKYVLAVVRPHTVASNQQVFYFADAQIYSNLEVVNTGVFRARNYDGSADYVDSAALTAGSLYIIQLRHDGTDLDMTVNSSIYSCSTGSTSDVTDTGIIGSASGSQYFFGDICALIFYAEDPGSAGRTYIKEWAVTKFSEAPAYNTTSFSTATLYGPNGADFITTFTATSACRYWWLEYGFAPDAATTSTFPRSKEYFGPFFDPGTNPTSFDCRRNVPERSAIEFLTGSRYFCQCSDPRFQAVFEWAGASDANAKIFLELLDEVERDPVFLYAPSTGAPEILAGQTLIHAALLPVESEVQPVYVNYNRLRLSAQEILG